MHLQVLLILTNQIDRGALTVENALSLLGEQLYDLWEILTAVDSGVNRINQRQILGALLDLSLRPHPLGDVRDYRLSTFICTILGGKRGGRHNDSARVAFLSLQSGLILRSHAFFSNACLNFNRTELFRFNDLVERHPQQLDGGVTEHFSESRVCVGDTLL